MKWNRSFLFIECACLTDCTHVYNRIYTYMDRYMNTYAYIHICIDVYIYVHIHMYKHIRMYIYIYIYEVCVRVYIYMCIRVYVDVHISSAPPSRRSAFKRLGM